MTQLLQLATGDNVRGMLRHYRSRPVEWIRDILGIELWETQAKIAQSVAEHQRTAVVSCHASGKTYVAADIALWFLYCFPDSEVITTAPVFRQVRENLWGEMERAYTQAKLPLGAKTASFAQCRLEIGPKWKAIGFATDKLEHTSGFHAQHILVIVDEASGVAQPTYDALEGIMASGRTVRVLLISQGTQTQGTFYEAFHSLRGQWSTHRIAAWDTPNFSGPQHAAWVAAGRPEGWTWPNPYLIKPEWVEGRRVAWGEGTPLWLVKVEGTFPPADPYAFVSVGDCDAATTRVLPESEADKGQIGLDVARSGMDLTVVVARKGPHVVRMTTKAITLGPEVEEMVDEMASATGIRKIVGDADGVGGPVLDYMKKSHTPKDGWEIVEFHSNARPRDVDTFLNAKAEAWTGFAQRVREGDLTIGALPKDQRDDLIADLVSIRKQFDARGRIKVESKDELRERIGRSPDRGDAVMLAFHQVGSFGGWLDYMAGITTPTPTAA